MSTRHPPKDPVESIVVAFDFAKEATSITLGATPVTCAVFWTTTSDSNPSAILSGAASISGTVATQVLQRIIGGVDMTDYALRCTATNQSGDVLVVAAILPVRRQPA